MQQLPLAGIIVTDFTSAWHGPHVTEWLAIMGAEVIKIESLERNDVTRQIFAVDTPDAGPEMSVENAAYNIGKKNITLNMSQPRAVELAKELIRRSDLVVENYGGSIMEQWGLGYPEIKKLKPDIIMYSGSGFGRTGPYKEYKAFATQIEAFAGSHFINGYLGGEPAHMASRGWNDIVAAVHGLYAILAALYYRAQTGKGQYIDLSMSETQVSFLAEGVMDYIMNGRSAGRTGNRDAIMAPHNCYRCRGDDRWLAITVATEDEWQSLCRVMGNPEWTGDPKFADMLNRWHHQEKLDKLITAWTTNHNNFQLMEQLQQAGVTAGVSLDMEGLVDDPHLKSRGYLVEMEHAVQGKLQLPNIPWKLSDTPRGNYHVAPLLGEHNDSVFGGLLGLSPEEIARLKEEQVIY